MTGSFVIAFLIAALLLILGVIAGSALIRE
jgi:hypothetical protein